MAVPPRAKIIKLALLRDLPKNTRIILLVDQSLKELFQVCLEKKNCISRRGQVNFWLHVKHAVSWSKNDQRLTSGILRVFATKLMAARVRYRNGSDNGSNHVSRNDIEGQFLENVDEWLGCLNNKFSHLPPFGNRLALPADHRELTPEDPEIDLSALHKEISEIKRKVNLETEKMQVLEDRMRDLQVDGEEDEKEKEAKLKEEWKAAVQRRMKLQSKEENGEDMADEHGEEKRAKRPRSVGEGEGEEENEPQPGKRPRLSLPSSQLPSFLDSESGFVRE